MYDIGHLESEWKKYRRKKLRAWYIFFFILLLLIVAVLFFLNAPKIDFTTEKGYFQSSKEPSDVQENPIGRLVPEENNMKSAVLVDSALERLELEKTAIEAVNKPVDDSPDILVDIPLLEDSKESMDTGIPKRRKKVHLEIIESTSATAYKDVENRFHQSHNIDDALFLAKSYYKNGNYKKAEYWALQANRLDETMEESLLIFVKSKVKLGNKNEAISILTSYVKKSDSQEAKKLLFQIENDKL